MKIDGKLYKIYFGNNVCITVKKEIETVIRRALKYYKNIDIMITKKNRDIIDNLLNG
jgi:uncharacterized protein YlzI (FlbEa/FlbD family)